MCLQAQPKKAIIGAEKTTRLAGGSDYSMFLLGITKMKSKELIKSIYG